MSDAPAITIALEASTRSGSVAVRAHGTTRHAILDEETSHASDLLPRLDALFREHDLAPDALDERAAVLVGTGPGSFTGLRVAIATAMGLVRGADRAPLLRGVSSIEALLFRELSPGERGVALLDARAGELYFAHARRTTDDLELVLEPSIVARDDLPEVPDDARLFGDAALVERELGRAVDVPRAPDARDVLALGALRLAQLGGEAPESVEPLYLRPFAAKTRKR